MITLFIDTSSSDVSISIIKDNEILVSIIKEIPNQHSVYTVSFIEEALKKSKLKQFDIEKIMVVTGPGSFTGVRIGVTIAKVYAYLLNIPIISISSLKMRSLSLTHDYCLSLIDAHHDHYYLGIYDEKNQEVIPEQFCHKDKVLEIIEKYHPIIISNNYLEIGNFKVEKQELNILKIVNYYINNTGENPHLVTPNYLKLPQVLEERHD